MSDVRDKSVNTGRVTAGFACLRASGYLQRSTASSTSATA